MLNICLEGLCCRVLHFTELLSCFGVVLHCIGLLCVALCYTILYCKVLKCISKAVNLKRNICLVSLPVTRKTSLSVKPILVLSSVALAVISWLSGSANVGVQVGRHQEQDGSNKLPHCAALWEDWSWGGLKGLSCREAIVTRWTQ